MYYVFHTRTSFLKSQTKSGAMSISQTKGEDSVVFRSIPGIPNPWWVYRIFPNGQYEREENLEKKEYDPGELSDFLENHFGG